MKKQNLISGIALCAAMGLAAAVFTPAFAGDESKPAAKAASSEAMAKVGSAAPEFTLVDTNGKSHNLADYTKAGKVVVLEWFNSECPYVKLHHEKQTTMTDTAKKFGDKVVWLAINSGAPGKQGHGKDKAAIESWKISYPVLNDEKGNVGKLYGAKTTPHMFIVDSKGMLVYAGAIDNDPKNEMAKDKKINYVDQALTEILAGKPVSNPETKQYGCSVKYGA
jgi:peroxiredoxin